jgi:hypothetical protein
MSHEVAAAEKYLQALTNLKIFRCDTQVPKWRVHFYDHEDLRIESGKITARVNPSR